MSERPDDWRLTRSSEDPNDVRAWQRVRKTAGVMYVVTLLVWLIAIIEAAILSFDVIDVNGMLERALVFAGLFLIELGFFVWLLMDVVFKRGR
jgi:hypothetical protein